MQPERKATAESQGARVAGFRVKLLAAMMAVVAAVTFLALYLAQRSLVANVEEDLQREFQGELAAFERAQEVRRVALMERCRALVRRPRIRAAFEDDALDLLYLNAENELADLVAPRGDSPAPTAKAEGTEAADESPRGLRAQFYRFLDATGAVIPPSQPRAVGALAPEEEAQLALKGVAEGPGAAKRPQIGYLARRTPEGEATVSEIVAVPIFSLETGEKLAALVLGFEPYAFGGRDARASGSGIMSGIWLRGRLHAPELSTSAEAALRAELRRGHATEKPIRIALGGEPHVAFSKRLNPDSGYPPAFEACVYPLGDLAARQRRLRWQVLGAGGVLLLVGLVGSHAMAARLARPVERLAIDSEENRAQRARAEAALETTSAELQRSARFSADASHQLKTPVTVLRAGLEELLARDTLTPETCAEVGALIHQTYRLSTLIEDLLLLSRMDAGRLALELGPVDLSQLIEAALDDLTALPDERGVTVETDFPAGLCIVGEKRYTAIVLQNLLENARKYNCTAGRIRIAAFVEGEAVRLGIGNTGRPIPAEAQTHIFERFHRGSVGENLPGYGLGLNLARELLRLHGGELRLVRSDETWTEFEASFRRA